MPTLLANTPAETGADETQAPRYDPDTGISLLAPWVGRPVRAGPDPSGLTANLNQAEPHLARSPLDPDVLLATFQEGRFSDGGAQSNGFALSRDGGFTWRRELFPGQTLANNGSYFRGTDPVVGFDLAGNLYHNALVALDNSFNLGAVIMQHSVDDGLTWTAPIEVYRGTLSLFPDKNWMAVNDFAGTPTTGRIVTSWTLFGGTGLPLFLSRSDNKGRTWSEPQRITPPNRPEETPSFQGSLPAFLPDGKLVILYHRFGESAAPGSGGSLEMSFSADGGTSFSPFRDSVVGNYWLHSDNTMRNGGFLPSMAVSRVSGEIFIAFQARYPSASSRSRILFVRSTRTEWNGSNPDFEWSLPVAIDEPIDGVSPVFPTIAASADGSQVLISYYTRRQDPGNPNALDLYVAASADGGSTWGISDTGDSRITPQSFDVRLATNTSRGYMIGDYFGAVAPATDDDSFVLCWVDTRTGNADPWTVRVQPALSDDPWRAWTAVNFSHAEREATPSAPLADFDGDHLFDRLEFALGLDPRTANALPRDQTFLTVGHPTFSTPPTDAIMHTLFEGPSPLTATPTSGPIVEADVGEGFWKRRSYEWGPNQSLHIAVGADHYLLAAPPFPWLTSYRRADNWIYSPWMGWLAPETFPWSFHYGLGWLYTNSPTDRALWFYSPDLGWLFTSAELFPYLYSNSEQSWWYYFVETRNPRFFYDFSTNEIIER